MTLHCWFCGPHVSKECPRTTHPKTQSHISEDQNPQLQHHKNIITHMQRETAQYFRGTSEHIYETAIFTVINVRTSHLPSRGEPIQGARVTGVPNVCMVVIVPLQARCGPEGSRRFRLPDFHDILHVKVVRSSASLTGRLYPQECSWYSFSLGAESTPGPWCGRKEMCH